MNDNPDKKSEYGSEITPELIKDWAVNIAKKAFESDGSMSSEEEEG